MVPVDKNNVGYRELPETDGKPENLSQQLTEASVWKNAVVALHYATSLSNFLKGDKTVRF